MSQWLEALQRHRGAVCTRSEESLSARESEEHDRQQVAVDLNSCSRIPERALVNEVARTGHLKETGTWMEIRLGEEWANIRVQIGGHKNCKDLL